MSKLKLWKIIRIITISILLLFLIFCLIYAFNVYNRNTTYPHIAIGGLTINNWKDAYIMEMGFILYVIGIPLIIDILLFIISIFKIKNLEKI